MKVAEKGSDRTAEAHILIEGRVQALEEYGQYVDGHDRAICCYVPVEEGHKIRVDCRFQGTTLAVVHDVLVDGVCRKTNSFISKSVQVQKRKAPFETFLYQMPDGIIDTDMSVALYSGQVNLDKEAGETVGTIELRVYVTRQFGVEHEVNDSRKFDKVKETADTGSHVATYKDVPPQYHMTFEKNCSPLEAGKGNREKKKTYAKRPGTEPWATFRFHYRTKESITDQNMDLTFTATDKSFAKKEPHVLELPPVPVLLLGSKPAGKNDGDVSVRTSSPPPLDTPSTPVKGSKKSQIAQPKVVINKKQQGKLAPSNSKSTSDMESIEPTQTTSITEPLIADAVDMSTAHDLQPISSFTKEEPPTNATDGEILRDKSSDNASAVMKGEDRDATVDIPMKSTKKAPKKSLLLTDSGADTKDAAPKMIIDDAVGKTDTNMSGPDRPTSSAPEVSTVPHPADLPSMLASTTVPTSAPALTPVLPSTRDLVKSGAKGFTSPLKKAASKPTSVDTTVSTVLQKPSTPSAPTTPIKRAPEGTLTPPPDAKRIKTDVTPSLTPTHMLRSASASPSARSLSVEAQVAEQRQLLEANRKKRADMAKKKAALDERMAPYKQHMLEELERLKQEVADEEAMMADEEEDYKTSEAMLIEFERAAGEM